MDEIWDRFKFNLKRYKVKHKHLVTALITTEIFGILVFLWILRTPLSQKFFTLEPKAYSVVSLSPKKRYLLSQGDLLTGKAIPGTRVKVLITPSFLKAQVMADSKGDWWYQIPPDLEKKVHTITFGNFDKKNKLVTFQSYKFRVQSNISVLRPLDYLWRRTNSLFNPKPANAQSLDLSFYSKYGLPNPTTPVDLTEDEIFRLQTQFLPYAYPVSQMKGIDWEPMAMWPFREAFLSNYMDNCLDGNPAFGEDADLNQNTPCTGWVNSKIGIAPNWQIGWGIFPWMAIDHLPEAIAVMRPGESIQQIGQRVIDESREQDRYPTRGVVIYKEPSDPITNPERFPNDYTLEQIIEGAKPLGDDTDRSKTCRPNDTAHADPLQDPKDCEMRQLLGILMKDPAISAYLLGLMWQDYLNQGNLPVIFRQWGPEYVNGKRINPYANSQEVSNTIAAFDNVAKDWDWRVLG